MRLNAKTAIVTGGSQGIGRGIAELFAEEGANVIIGDLQQGEFDHERISVERLDVTKESDWRSLVDSTIERHGAIDILVNNAGGVGSFEPIDTIEIDDWHRIIDLNLNGSFLGIRTVVPHMRRAGSGSIINISSIWGITSAVGVSAYTASKGAVRLMSKNAALSYVDNGIRVNSLHPGIIDTPMVAAQDKEITDAAVGATPMKRLGTPREIAFGALFLASDDSSYMTGAELVIDGGYTSR